MQEKLTLSLSTPHSLSLSPHSISTFTLLFISGACSLPSSPPSSMDSSTAGDSAATGRTVGGRSVNFSGRRGRPPKKPSFASDARLAQDGTSLLDDSRVVLQRAGAACARPLKGGVWPSLPANASDRKDSFSTATGARIDQAHQPTRGWLTVTFWVPFCHCLGREGASPSHSEHFRAMKMFY
jgi:hypothetical protein